MGTNLNGTYFYVKHQKTILNFYAKEKKGERERKRQLDDWISSRGDGAQTEIWSWMIWKVNKVLIPFKLDHLKNKIWLLSIKIAPRNIAKTRIMKQFLFTMLQLKNIVKSKYFIVWTAPANVWDILVCFKICKNTASRMLLTIVEIVQSYWLRTSELPAVQCKS